LVERADRKKVIALAARTKSQIEFIADY